MFGQLLYIWLVFSNVYIFFPFLLIPTDIPIFRILTALFPSRNVDQWLTGQPVVKSIPEIANPNLGPLGHATVYINFGIIKQCARSLACATLFLPHERIWLLPFLELKSLMDGERKGNKIEITSSLGISTRELGVEWNAPHLCNGKTFISHSCQLQFERCEKWGMGYQTCMHTSPSLKSPLDFWKTFKKLGSRPKSTSFYSPHIQRRRWAMTLCGWCRAGWQCCCASAPWGARPLGWPWRARPPLPEDESLSGQRPGSSGWRRFDSFELVYH